VPAARPSPLAPPVFLSRMQRWVAPAPPFSSGPLFLVSLGFLFFLDLDFLFARGGT